MWVTTKHLMGDLLTAKQNFIDVGGEAEHGQTKNIWSTISLKVKIMYWTQKHVISKRPSTTSIEPLIHFRVTVLCHFSRFVVMMKVMQWPTALWRLIPLLLQPLLIPAASTLLSVSQSHSSSWQKGLAFKLKTNFVFACNRLIATC